MDAAVLAGGRSSRMNFQDKSRLIYKDETFLELIVSRLENFNRKMIITNSDPNSFPPIDADFYKDLIPDIGPLGGIYTALKRTGEERVFITTCDMPLVTQAAIETICQAGDYDIIIPVFQGKYEMLFTVYSRKCLPRIKEMIEAGQYKITGVFKDKSLKVRKIEVDDLFMESLKNINTPNEYKKLRDLLKNE